MFPVFKQVSAETVIRLCGKFYHLLYAYFLLNIVAKIIKIQRHSRELERKMSGSFFCETQCTHTLQRVMIAAARVVSDTRKFDHGLTQILRDDLQWLDVADRVTYKLSVIMHRCHDIGYPLLDAEHSLCTAPWSGTPCRTTSVHSRTMNPLDRA